MRVELERWEGQASRAKAAEFEARGELDRARLELAEVIRIGLGGEGEGLFNSSSCLAPVSVTAPPPFDPTLLCRPSALRRRERGSCPSRSLASHG